MTRNLYLALSQANDSSDIWTWQIGLGVFLITLLVIGHLLEQRGKNLNDGQRRIGVIFKWFYYPAQYWIVEDINGRRVAKIIGGLITFHLIFYFFSPNYWRLWSGHPVLFWGTTLGIGLVIFLYMAEFRVLSLVLGGLVAVGTIMEFSQTHTWREWQRKLSRISWSTTKVANRNPTTPKRVPDPPTSVPVTAVPDPRVWNIRIMRGNRKDLPPDLYEGNEHTYECVDVIITDEVFSFKARWQGQIVGKMWWNKKEDPHGTFRAFLPGREEYTGTWKLSKVEDGEFYSGWAEDHEGRFPAEFYPKRR